MKILWITNVIFPDACKVIGIPQPVFGGWLYGQVKLLSNRQEITVAVASLYDIKLLRKDFINKIIYYTIPYIQTSGYPKCLEKYWKAICDDFKPDLIHIHGTEYPKALACMRACPDLKYFVSFQGIVSVIARYQHSGIPVTEIVKNITLRDILRRDTFFRKRKRGLESKKYEKEYLTRARVVIGRTDWDCAHALSLNGDVNYQFCNESLRDNFYTTPKWEIDSMKRFSIFLSQARDSIKGLHMVLQAANLLKAEFPAIKIRIGGQNITKANTFRDRLKMGWYGKYIRSLIRKLRLQNHVEFLGLLDASSISNEYRTANVFICPSSIENSPNSLGEAQIIGTPVIASFVGGIPDMVTHKKTGLLYRFEETEMLAYNIKRIFLDDKLASYLSENGIVEAEKRHDKVNNLKQLLQIYNQVIK